jgi:hypothetical protein
MISFAVVRQTFVYVREFPDQTAHGPDARPKRDRYTGLIQPQEVRMTNLLAGIDQCPSCQVGTGLPFSVSYDNGVKTLKFRCPDCAHEWTVLSPEKSLTDRLFTRTS